MKFDGNIELEAKQARVYLNKLITDGSKFEIVKKKQQRTIKQNAYLHVCIEMYAVNFGLTLEEAKTDLKRDCPYHDFTRYTKVNKVTGKSKLYLTSTKNYTTAEATKFIDWLRTFSSQHGCYIPTSQEYLENKFAIDKEIERNRQFL